MTTFTPPSPPFIPARWYGGDQTPKVIVMHGTVSPCVKGGARSVARFFQTESNKTSAHYVRDPYETIQCVPDHTVAYHCGHNQDSIGYELCDPQAGSGARWADKAHNLMLAGAAEDVARLCLAYEIPAVKIGPADLIAGKRGICGHVDETNAFHQSTHTDPGSAFPWPRFIALVKSEIANLKGATVKKPTSPTFDEGKIVELVTEIKADWKAGKVDRAKLSTLQKTGSPTYAAAAAAAGDGIDKLMTAFVGTKP